VTALDQFEPDPEKRSLFVTAQVVPAPNRCVQCGICSHDCPVDIDVRRHVWLDEPVKDSYCLSCGECVERCPRGLLRFEEIPSKRFGALGKGIL
jgi:ferredoxin